MTPIQHEIDNAARLDTEILIASRIMEQAESACRSAHFTAGGEIVTAAERIDFRTDGAYLHAA